MTAASGAAPLGKDLAEFYSAIGMPLIEGYGLTEAGVAIFNPLDAPYPKLDLPIEQRPIGGLGVFIVKSVADSVDYRRDGGRNVVTVRKKIVR